MPALEVETLRLLRTVLGLADAELARQFGPDEKRWPQDRVIVRDYLRLREICREAEGR